VCWYEGNEGQDPRTARYRRCNIVLNGKLVPFTDIVDSETVLCRFSGLTGNRLKVADAKDIYAALDRAPPLELVEDAPISASVHPGGAENNLVAAGPAV